MTPPPGILLVDDDAIGAELTLAALQELHLGVPVQLAADGEEALDLLFQHRPGNPAATPYLVLLDLKMPKVDGHEVLRQVRASARFHALRIVVLTSSDQREDMARCRQLGIDAYLTKPPSIFDLIAQFRAIAPLLAPPPP